MAELALLGAVVAGVVGTVRYFTGAEKKTPRNVLTPPMFDRRTPEAVLIATPLEQYLYPRNRLFAGHYTGVNAEHALDLRVRMAPSDAVEGQDLAAHIYLPRLQPGQPVRPMIKARFHLQHSQDPNSFANFVLRTEGGGQAYVNSAINLSAAYERARLKYPTGAPITLGANAPQAPPRYVAGAPRGLSAFFNLPVFGTPDAPMFAHAAGAAAAAAAESKPFEMRHALRDSSTVGLRYDEYATNGEARYSLGLHCDPLANLAAVQQGRGDAAQVNAWVAQQTDQFRMVAEGTIQPLRSGLPADAGAAAALAGAEGVPASSARLAAVVPPRFAASLPALLSSRLGLFYTPQRAGKRRSGYEVGVTVANDARGRQELVASYFHHLVVRRRIHNPLEKKENMWIHNYLDLGLEVVYRNDEPLHRVNGAAAAATRASAQMTPPSLRFGAAWQINRNTLVKLKVQDSSISALVGVKSWWEPSASAALSVNHGLTSRQTTFGLSINVENVGEALFAQADPSYRRRIASQMENVANRVDAEGDDPDF